MMAMWQLKDIFNSISNPRLKARRSFVLTWCEISFSLQPDCSDISKECSHKFHPLSLCRAIMWIQSEHLLDCDCGWNFFKKKDEKFEFHLEGRTGDNKREQNHFHGQFSIWIANRSARVDGNGEKFKLKSIERERKKRKHKNKPVIDAFSAQERSMNLLHRANTTAES